MSKIRAFKIRKKDYHLTNEKTGEKITVFPPGLPGANADNTAPKNEKGEWLRRYDIKDRNSITLAEFAGDTVVLSHLPKAAPSIVINGESWITRAIEAEVVATAPVAADGVVATDATAPAVASKTKKARSGGGKSKTKLMDAVEAGVKAAATSAPKRAHVRSHKALAKVIKGDKK